MNLKFDIKTVLTQAEKEQWEALGSDDFVDNTFSSVYWIEAMGTADGIRQNFLLAYEESGEIVGGLPFDYSTESGKVPEHYKLEALLKGYNPFYTNMEPIELNEDLERCLVFTNRAAKSCDYRFKISFSDEERRELLTALINRIEDFLVEKNGDNVSMLYVPEKAELLNSTLHEKGYITATIGARYYIPIEFKTFDEFLERFSGKVRRNIIREMKKLDEYEVKLEKISLNDGLDRYVELAGSNFEKYGFSNFNLQSYSRRIRLLGDNFKDNVFLINMIYKDEVVGSCLFIKYKDSLIARSVGIVEDIPKSLAAYFNLVYYKGVQLALEYKVKYLEFGDGLDSVKLSRGCTMEKLKIYTNTDSMAIKNRMADINSYVEKILMET